MLRRCSLLVLLSLAVLLNGCSAPRRVAAESVPKEQPADLVPHSREANDIARFLAGMPGTPGSPYAALEANEVWKEHRRIVDAAWQDAEREQLPGLRKFQADELSVPALEGRTVFYPFSGPDALVLTSGFLSPQSGQGVHRSVVALLGSPGALPRTLVVHHRHDECRFTLPSGVQPFLDWAKGKARVIWLDGGSAQGDPCQAGGHHGFAGLDGQVVNAVVNFAAK